MHTQSFPLNVLVTTDYVGSNTSGESQTFDFYVQTGPFMGNPIVTAATCGIWTPFTTDGDGSLTAPANSVRLPIASISNSLGTVFATRPGGI